MGKTEKAKGHSETNVTTIEKCAGEGCKATARRFSFCDEHYEQFKFGLIKKTGQPVSDYDKKFEHYEAWKEAVAARKAA